MYCLRKISQRGAILRSHEFAQPGDPFMDKMFTINFADKKFVKVDTGQVEKQKSWLHDCFAG